MFLKWPVHTEKAIFRSDKQFFMEQEYWMIKVMKYIMVKL